MTLKLATDIGTGTGSGWQIRSGTVAEHSAQSLLDERPSTISAQATGVVTMNRNVYGATRAGGGKRLAHFSGPE
jgi:hypothetical protein